MNRVYAAIILLVVAVMACALRDLIGHTSPSQSATPKAASPSPNAPPVETDAGNVPLSEARESVAESEVEREEDTSASLTISVNGPAPLKGPVRLALFHQPNGFPNHEKALRVLSVKPVEPTTVARIDDLVPGRYAVAAYLDANNDGVLNKAAFGVPTEPYGFSNNARGQYGPPSFQAAAFEVSTANDEAEITLK